MKAPMSRKKFLRMCGSIVAGGAVATMSGELVRRRLEQPAEATLPGRLSPMRQETFSSPYRLVSSFDTGETIESLALHNDRLYVATADAVSAFDHHGRLLHRFSVGEPVRDVAVDDSGIYLLHRAGIQVYTPAGALLRSWEACSDLSDYCALALASGCVFATDVSNKNICKYTAEGDFVKFISSPNGFIIPSYTFGIESVGDVLYCSNSGRHQVESYTTDGEYLGSFGKHGVAPGLFAGCCNPVYLSCTPSGDVITSEKGIPRISCYGRDGKFRGILLDGKMLGSGKFAYDVKVQKDKIFVAGKKTVAVFRYDSALAENTACAGCGVSCPLRG